MIRTTLACAAIATIAAVPTAPAAHAEDQRPCVSRIEFRTAPGMNYMNGKTNPGTPLTRHQLERFWDVEGLGIVDPEVSDGGLTLWMYPICAYSFSEAQVWVPVQSNGVADVAFRWYNPGAMYNGHQE